MLLTLEAQRPPVHPMELAAKPTASPHLPSALLRMNEPINEVHARSIEGKLVENGQRFFPIPA